VASTSVESTGVNPSPASGAFTYRVTGVSAPGGDARVRANQSGIEVDATSGRDGVRPGPAELLAAALAACILKNVERFSQLLPFRYQAAEVEVTAEREAPPPRITRLHYRLVLATDEPAHRVELLHRNVVKFGTITNTLAAACELTGEVLARPPAGPQEGADP
jgi:uncharacterized OsmC-like protein